VSHYHAAVWIDHHHAKVFHIAADDVQTLDLPAPGHGSGHGHGGTHSGKRPDLPKAFADQIIKALGDAHVWLILGPGDAKTHFSHFLRDHHPNLASRVAGVEAIDHPSDREIIAFARNHFTAIDHMRAQRG